MPAATWWDVDASAYHADCDTIGSSMAKLFRRSPEEYYLRYVVQRIPADPPTDAMRLGTLTHLALWEPDRLHDVIALPPMAWNLRSSKDRAARDAWLESLDPKRIPTTDEELGYALSMARKCRSNPIVAAMLERDHLCEAAVRWECRHTGLPCKAMFDVITQDNGPVLVGDLKTMFDYPDTFRNNASRFGYANQAAWYLEAASELGYDDARFLPIAVRTKIPWEVLVNEFTTDTLSYAHAQNLDTRARIADCVETGVWEHPDAGDIVPISLPAWMFS